METRSHERMCVYCGESVLTGNERPEHPIPAAIGSSLVIHTVCDRCNEWASVHVDRPFLHDDQVRIYRAEHDVRDSRRSARRRVAHPLLHGTTSDGRHVTIDGEGRPQIAGQIVDHGDGTYSISASTDEEVDKLLGRLAARLLPDGFKPQIARRSVTNVRPTINANVSMKLRRWTSMAAKVGLGIGSIVYEPAWRASSDAVFLRRVMRDGHDGDGNVLIPEFVGDHVVRELAGPPNHVVYFASHRRTTRMMLVLFGEAMIAAPIDTTGRMTPRTAWRLDPTRPRADGRTTLEELIARAASRRA